MNMKRKSVKKEFFVILFLVGLFFLQPTHPLFAEKKERPYRYVKIKGRKLLVDFNKNGRYRPFFIRGVGYSPYPVGRHPSDWGYPDPNDPRNDNFLDDEAILKRDFTILQEMYANTIRIWKGDDTFDLATGRYPVHLTRKTFNLAQQFGLHIIAGFWINTWGAQCQGDKIVYNTPDFTDKEIRKDLMVRFRHFVEMFKNHPALLFWAVGNENNYHLDPNDINQIRGFYSLMNELGKIVREVEGEKSYHPLAIVNGDLKYLGDPVYGADDKSLPYVDIWGVNVYRGDSFGDLFREFQKRTKKPLWIAEFGVDAWNALNPYEPSYGYEDQETQARWDGQLWDEVVLNNSFLPDLDFKFWETDCVPVTIGATVMEYSDEWWKPYEWIEGGRFNATHDYFGTPPQDTTCPPDGIIDWYPPSPDNHFTDEWWGIVAIEKNEGYQSDIMHPREAYFALKDRFQCVAQKRPFYAGPENDRSCDGSSACCRAPYAKAKNGKCCLFCSHPKRRWRFWIQRKLPQK